MNDAELDALMERLTSLKSSDLPHGDNDYVGDVAGDALAALTQLRRERGELRTKIACYSDLPTLYGENERLRAECDALAKERDEANSDAQELAGHIATGRTGRSVRQELIDKHFWKPLRGRASTRDDTKEGRT